MKEFGVSFKGGLARGFGAIGVIKFLEEERLRPKVVAGSSSGAFVAAGLAMGAKAENSLEMLQSLNFLKDFVLVPTIFSNKSLVDPDLYKQKLLDFFGNVMIEEVPIKLIIFATNPQTRERIFIEKGLLVDALMASSSFRPIFPKVNIQGQPLIDGDFSESYSTEKLRSYGAEIIIGIAYKKRSGNEKRRQKDPVDIEILYGVDGQGYIDFINLNQSSRNAYEAATLSKAKILKMLMKY